MSPRYGVKVRSKVLNFLRDGAPEDLQGWLRGEAEKAMKLPGMAAK